MEKQDLNKLADQMMKKEGHPAADQFITYKTPRNYNFDWILKLVGFVLLFANRVGSEDQVAKGKN